VWVWMGDCDKAATFERPAFAPTDSTQVSVVKFVVPCNWAQILEGAIDSAHSSTLHSSDMRPARVGGAKATDKNWLRPSTDKAMKLGDFTGIRGIPMQDMAMWASMGPITDRTRDRLGASDLAIVEFRRIMVDAARRFVADGTALGAEVRKADAALCAFEGVIPK